MGSVPRWATVSDSSIPLHSGASEHPVGHPMLTACIAGVQEPSIYTHTHTAHLLLLPPGSAPPAWVTLALCTVSSWRCSPEGTCCLSCSSTVVISWCGSAILQPSYLKEGTEAVRYQAKPGALSVCSMQPPWFSSRVPMASSEPTAAGTARRELLCLLFLLRPQITSLRAGKLRIHAAYWASHPC